MATKPIPIRLKENDLAMLDRLMEQYNTNRATIMRMALKRMYDSTFGEKKNGKA